MTRPLSIKHVVTRHARDRNGRFQKASRVKVFAPLTTTARTVVDERAHNTYDDSRARPPVNPGITVARLEDPAVLHPLKPVFADCLDQVRFGKGQRHGGDAKPFLEQSWAIVAKSHGLGFLTGQAQKKLVEAMESGHQHLNPEAFERELLGSMAYLGMAVLEYRRTRR
jgi:hypothetical protein